MTTKQQTTKRDQKFVKSLVDPFIECRSLRHAWETTKVGLASEVVDPERIAMGYANAVVRRLKCLRCGMYRFDFMTNGGRRPARLQGQEAYSVFYRRYVPPEGYNWSSSNAALRPEMRDYHREFFSRYQVRSGT